MIKKPAAEYTPDELESVVCGVEEQETSVTRYRGDDTWDVWTSDNTVLTKMKKLMAASPEECKLLQVAWNKDGTPTQEVCQILRPEEDVGGAESRSRREVC